MKLTTLLSVALVPALGLLLHQDGSPAPQAQRPPAQEAFELSDLLARGKRDGRAWTQALERDSLLAGVYHLAAGSRDPQGPHELDEVYYVVEGSAGFTAGGVEHEAHAGSIFFVQAGVEHRFHDVAEDLVVVVFFSKVRGER